MIKRLFKKLLYKKNQNSLASLIVLNYKFGMMPILKIEEDFPVFPETRQCFIDKISCQQTRCLSPPEGD